MKKKLLFLLVIPLLLAGCNNKTNKDSSSEVNSVESYVSEVSTQTSVASSSEDASSVISSQNEVSSQVVISSSESSSAIPVDPITSIPEIKQKADTLKSKVNQYNIAESNIPVSIDLLLLARFDHIGSKSGMGSNYHLLMSDGTNHIYVKVEKKVYEKVETRSGSVLHIEGNVSYYCGEAEITSTDQDITLVDTPIEMGDVFTLKGIDEVFTMTDNMSLNCKGCNAGEFVSIKAEYYAKMDDVVALFRQGNDIIFVHGPSKWLNGMSVGKTYELKGVPSVRNFRPGLECVDKKEVNVSIEPVNQEKLVKIDQSIYQIKYEVEKNPTYPTYSNLFKKLALIEGYVNYYIKNYKYYTVIEFTNKDAVYNAYTNAASAKTLFIKNDESTNLATEKDDIYNPFTNYYGYYEDTNEPIKISFVGVPYLWNTQGYWQVYAITNTITTVE